MIAVTDKVPNVWNPGYLMIEYDLVEEANLLKSVVRGFPMHWFEQREWSIVGQGLGDLACLAAGAALLLAVPSWWVATPVWILMAGRIHGLGILMHDMVHVRHLESQPAKRLFIDALLFYPIVMNMDYYGYAHMLHHQWSNVPGKDPYFFPLNRWSPPKFLAFIVFATLFLPFWLILRLASFPLTLLSSSLRREHARWFGQFGMSPDRDDPVRVQESEKLWIWTLGPTIYWYAVAGWLTWTGSWGAFGWAFGVPLILSVLVGQARLAGDHVYEPAKGNHLVSQLAGSTNVEAPWWQRLVLAPHAAGFHGMHHVVPNVPNWHWEEVHQRFKDSGSRVYASTVYRGYGEIFNKLLKDQFQAWGKVAEGAPESPPLSAMEEPGFHQKPRLSFDGTFRPETSSVLITVPPIERINQLSKEKGYGIEDLDWKSPDMDKLHAPECMSHLYFTPLYDELTPEERLTYNQAFAEGVAEQFVFLEQVLLVRGLRAFLRLGGKSLPDPLIEACEFFVQEEDKHSAMFRRLLLESNPEVYEKTVFDIYRLTAQEEKFLATSLESPTLFLWWIWVATVFEEKTIDFHKKYQAARDGMDPMHMRVHRFHCLDELRHLQMDHHFVEALWVPAPWWKRELNAWLFEKVMTSFVRPRRTVIASVNRMVRRHPRLEPMQSRLIEAGMSVHRSRAWHEATYSRETLPNTFALFDRFPELHRMSALLPLYSPREPIGSTASARSLVEAG